MPEYLRRTAITRLSPSSRQATLIEETIDEWRQGCNLAVSIGQTQGITSKRKLQSAAYDELRDQTGLGSQHAVLASHAAAQALDTVSELSDSDCAPPEPEFTSPTVKYDARTLTVFQDEEKVSLSTTQGRIRCELELPDDDDGYQWQYLDSEEWELTESTLTARDDGYFVHLGFRKPKTGADDSRETAEGRTVLGVDLGMDNLAVTSTAHFESGSEMFHRHGEFERARRGLQRTGTRSAHQSLLELGDREERYTCDVLHQVSSVIVSEAVAYRCDYIAFENLHDIQDALPSIRKYKQWAHARLVEYVQYKAEEYGIDVVFVDPENTSRRCFECGHESERNRVERDHFHCQSCGAEANADYNAAKNIGWRYVRRGHQTSRRTGRRQLALKSGTVTPNRGFDPYPTGGAEAESTDKLRSVESESVNSSERGRGS